MRTPIDLFSGIGWPLVGLRRVRQALSNQGRLGLAQGQVPSTSKGRRVGRVEAILRGQVGEQVAEKAREKQVSQHLFEIVPKL